MTPSLPFVGCRSPELFFFADVLAAVLWPRRTVGMNASFSEGMNESGNLVSSRIEEAFAM
jgi:hypothetical protein